MAHVGRTSLGWLRRYIVHAARLFGRGGGGLAGVGGQKLRELDLALVFRAFLVALGVAQA